MQIENITVIGRRWFQKTYGNTYFSADIFINGELVHSISESYGYGDYYLQAAGEWLQENGYTKQDRYRYGGLQSLPSYCREKGIQCVYSVSDVQRKKDL